MPDPVDPASLEGDELDRWYRRSPQDIEQERQVAADERHAAFFGSPVSSEPLVAGPADVLWVANGAGGYRPVRPGAPDYQAALGPVQTGPDDLPENPAAPEASDSIEIGNPHNPRLRREWERANGRLWPRTDDGRNYHVAHKRAIADGGTNTLDNIEPMHPTEHIAQHVANGDPGRWARRAIIARAFGGKVEPPTPGLRMNGLGILRLIPDITGILSGRIRTDTPSHFWYDMAGVPAPGDNDQTIDPVCRSMGIAAPGSKCA